MEEERVLKDYITKWENWTPKPSEHSRLACIDMLVPVPFLLTPRRPWPNSMRPHSMCVHAKAKTRKLADKQWKEEVRRAYEKY